MYNCIKKVFGGFNGCQYRSLLTSLPFWAILVANFGNNWGFHLLLTELPIYMETVLKKDINSNVSRYVCKYHIILIATYTSN